MEIDRPNGILNEKARKYLLDESDIEPKSKEERSVRRNIRHWLENAVLDFSILYSEDGHRTDSRDRGNAFGGTQPVEEDGEKPRVIGGFIDDMDEVAKRPPKEIEDGLVAAVAFIYSVANSAGLSANHVIKRGLKKYARAESPEWMEPKVLLQMQTREMVAQRAKKKIQNNQPPDELEDEEVRALIATAGGPFTPERIHKYLRGEWSWPPEEIEDNWNPDLD